MKRVVPILLLVLLVLSGCDSLLNRNQFVGIWTHTVTFTGTYAFYPDLTFAITYSDGTEPNSGIYDYSDTRLLLTYVDGTTTMVLYEFRDADTLILTASRGIGIAYVLMRAA